jgi:hypothetical protein
MGKTQGMRRKWGSDIQASFSPKPGSQVSLFPTKEHNLNLLPYGILWKLANSN